MRLLTLKPKRGGAARLGVLLTDERVLEVGAAARAADMEMPFDTSDMLSLIDAGRPGRNALRRLLKSTSGHGAPLSGFRVLAPIPRPRRNVFCVGWNYLEHFEEGAKARPHVQEMPAHPALFTKATNTVIGPYDDVPLHARVTQKLDWEVELALVIGRGGRDLTEANALDHVFGYTVVNDVSAREVQRHHGQQWFRGKSLDGTCPMGPWIVTADEVPDPQALRLTCRLNGVTKQDSNTKHMYFKLPRILAELSAGLTLEAGDIVITGTPAGVGHARNPPEFMREGDVLETEVEGIGLLRNRIHG